MWADSSTGYDSELTGSFEQKKGLRVCKVGITTDRTCGVVTDPRIRAGFFNNGMVAFEVRNGGAVISSDGDSGGAWFTQSKPFRLVGIHSSGNVKVNSTTAYATPWVEVAEKYGLSLYTSKNTTPMN